MFDFGERVCLFLGFLQLNVIFLAIDGCVGCGICTFLAWIWSLTSGVVQFGVHCV